MEFILGNHGRSCTSSVCHVFIHKWKRELNMKLNVGDYVRTKDGYIAKIVDIEKKENYDYVTYYFDKKVSQYGWDDGNIYDITMLEINDTSFKENKDMIIKSSPNIIDLIEVGDYVNGWRVNRVEKEEGGIFFTIGNISSFVSKNETDPYLTRDHNDQNRICKMESIVTKEQFEAMQYVIKENKYEKRNKSKFIFA